MEKMLGCDILVKVDNVTPTVSASLFVKQTARQRE